MHALFTFELFMKEIRLPLQQGIIANRADAIAAGALLGSDQRILTQYTQEGN